MKPTPKTNRQKVIIQHMPDHEEYMPYIYAVAILAPVLYTLLICLCICYCCQFSRNRSFTVPTTTAPPTITVLDEIVAACDLVLESKEMTDTRA